MAPMERALLGVAVGVVPGVLAGTFLAPVGFGFAAVIAFAGMLLGAILAVLRVPPFPWLESKMRSSAK